MNKLSYILLAAASSLHWAQAAPSFHLADFRMQVRTRFQTEEKAGHLRYEFRAFDQTLDEAVRRQDSKASQATLNEIRLAAHEQLNKTLEDKVVRYIVSNLASFAGGISESTPVLQSPEMKQVVAYYQKDRAALTHLNIAIADFSFSGFVLAQKGGPATAMFVPPQLYADEIPVTLDLPQLRFQGRVEIPGLSQYLYAPAYAEALGGKNVIFLRKEIKGKLEPLVVSILVHETRHFLDFQSQPALFDPRRALKERNEIIDRLNEGDELRTSFSKMEKSEAFQNYQTAAKTFLKSKGAMETEVALDNRVYNAYLDFYENWYEQMLPYYQSRVETNAFAEQVAFLKSAHHYTLAAVLKEVITNSGELMAEPVETIGPRPPMPEALTTYFTSLYDSN